jgi:hypothetical protein
MSRSSSSDNSNNSEDFGEKYHREINPYNAPWLQPTPIQYVDPTNDEQWHDREDSLNIQEDSLNIQEGNI